MARRIGGPSAVCSAVSAPAAARRPALRPAARCAPAARPGAAAAAGPPPAAPCTAAFVPRRLPWATAAGPRPSLGGPRPPAASLRPGCGPGGSAALARGRLWLASARSARPVRAGLSPLRPPFCRLPGCGLGGSPLGARPTAAPLPWLAVRPASWPPLPCGRCCGPRSLLRARAGLGGPSAWARLAAGSVRLGRCGLRSSRPGALAALWAAPAGRLCPFRSPGRWGLGCSHSRAPL